MNKKGVKIFAILLVVLIVALLFGTIIRKAIIISDLNEKVIQQNAKNNIYVKFQTANINEEIYKKDNIVKTILEDKENQKKVTKITNGTTRMQYTESTTENTLSTYEDTTNYGDVISNYVSTNILGVMEKISFIITSKISTQNEEDKECYVISNNNNPNSFKPEGRKDLEVYIEKETGLPIKSIETYDDGQEIITTYEYAFDIVTDDDVQPLDNSKFVSE